MTGKDAFDIAEAKCVIDVQIRRLTNLRAELDSIQDQMEKVQDRVATICSKVLNEVKNNE